MLKAYKYRLFPTQKQSDLLAKHFGHCRFIYNHFLGKSITEFKEKPEATVARINGGFFVLSPKVFQRIEK